MFPFCKFDSVEGIFDLFCMGHHCLCFSCFGAGGIVRKLRCFPPFDINDQTTLLLRV